MIGRDNVKTPNLQGAANLANDENNFEDKICRQTPGIRHNPITHHVPSQSDDNGQSDEWYHLPSWDKGLGRHMRQHEFCRHFDKE
mmetsp:Transcript_78822/g.154721  ORF Transcript_78822/g.154721 Transcript_78822/m.154721 type:complete len:85 (-) Transcript_78822:185-439(-)